MKILKLLKYGFQRYFFIKWYGYKPGECGDCHLAFGTIRNSLDGKLRCKKCDKIVNKKNIRLMKSLEVKEKMGINMRELAKDISKLEGKKKEMSIAQIAECLKYTMKILGQHSDKEIIRAINRYRGIKWKK